MESASPARKAYAAELSLLEQEVLEMVGRAEVMFTNAVNSLYNMDRELAKEAVESDDEIDRMDIQVEQDCLRLLALRQPIASDLREIGTVLKIITDIERIGDLSVDIAKITRKVDKLMGRADYVDLPRMATIVRTMLHSCIQAFVRRDITEFAEIQRLEDTVDQHYRDLRDQIHAYMTNNPDQVVAASWIILAVHHIERVADHAMNIAERVGFMVTGELRQLGIDRDSGEPTGAG